MGDRLDALWKDAFDSLKEKHKQYLHQHASVKIHDLLRDVESKQDEAWRSRPQAKRLNGERLSFYDVYRKIAFCLKKFIEVGDIAVQYDPGHAALPWAAVRFIMTAAVSDVERHAVIIEGIEAVSRTIVWATIQAKLFLFEAYDASNELREEFRQLFITSLTFLAKSHRFYSEHRTKRILGSLSTFHDSYREIILRLDAQRGLVEQFCNQISRKDQKDQFVYLESNRKELFGVLAEIQNPLSRIEYTLRTNTDVQDDKEREDILNWVSDVPFGKHHNEARTKVLKGTGLWLLQNPVFEEWEGSSASQMMWLHGMPGCGKTCLVSVVLQQLKSGPSSSNVVHFYCLRSTSELARSEPCSILRCLLRQLCVDAGDGEVDKEILTRYKSRVEEGPLIMDEVRELIIQICCKRSVTYMVIDALDECDRETRNELIEALEDILLQSNGLVKIFASSRDDQDIVCGLRKYPNMVVQAQNNQCDIERFVITEVDKRISRRKLLPTETVSADLRDRVVRVLCAGAQGMFRWVELQLQYLCQLRLVHEVEERLGRLPQKLAQIYSELYDRYERLHTPAENHIMQRAFSLLLCNQQSLGAGELISLATWDYPSHVKVSAETLLDICFNLITVEREFDNICSFAHLSVREYFEEWREEFDDITNHETATIACLEILKDHSERLTSPAAAYADFFWVAHLAHVLQASSNDLDWVWANRTVLYDALTEFLFVRKGAFESWNFRNYTRFSYDGSLLAPVWPAPHDRFHVRNMIASPANPIFAACALQLQSGLANIIDDDRALVNTRNTLGATPLALASHYGNLDALKILLAKGADPKARSKDGSAAIHLAAQQGHLQIAEVLLGSVDVDVPDGSHKTALQIAAEAGQLHIVELLLHYKADPCKGWANNALNIAAWRNHSQIVQTILAHSSSIMEPKAVTSLAMTGLYPAIVQDNVLMLNHILAKIPNLNEALDFSNPDQVEARFQTSGRMLTPLSFAICSGSISVVKMLLGRSDIVRDSPELCSMGQLASMRYQGASSIVVPQLSSNRRKYTYYRAIADGRTPLSFAAAGAKNNHFNILEMLASDPQIDRNSRDDGGRTPLIWAATTGNIYGVRLLLSYADVERDAKDAKGKTALIWAAIEGSNNIVSLLLDGGTDPNVADNDGRSALSWAAGEGNIDSVEVFLKHHTVDLYGTDWLKRSALSWAAESCQKEIVELLLGALHDQAPSFSRVATGDNVQRGALRSLSPKVESVIQQTDMFGRFPAMWATLNGCFTIVSLIATFSVFTKQSENSASSFSPEFLNHTDKLGCSVVHYAAASGLIMWKKIAATNIDQTDSAGWTVTHWAAYFGQDGVIDDLIDRGASMIQKDANGWLPYHVALFAGHLATSERLKAYRKIDGNETSNYDLPTGPGIFNSQAICDSCSHYMIGVQNHCVPCVDFDLCFHCWQFAALIHPGHEFETTLLSNE